MAMPTNDCCISCGSHLSPEGWCVLQESYRYVEVVSHACNLPCAMTLARKSNKIAPSDRPATKITNVNEATYNPLNFMKISPYEILFD